MKHWERVRVSVPCAYGCGDIRHPDWVYIHGRFAVCEKCAADMGIRRPVFGQPSDTPKEPHNLVPATPAKRGMTAVADVADDLQGAPTFAAFMSQLRRMWGKK